MPFRCSIRRRQAQNCEFCGSAQLVAYTETEPAFRPESVLPFTVSEGSARDRIRQWYGRLWLAPNALKKRALTDTVKGIYLPYWTFDARADAQWTADAGHYYYTTESYQEGGQTRTRQVRHVRWTPAAGSLTHFFDDDLVCASVGVHSALLRGIEPFPTATLKPYDAGYVAGWVVERYQIDLVGAARSARAAMDAKVTQLCAAEIPGDTYRNLVVSTNYAHQTFKHILAPVWLMTYTYGARSFQCVQNGVTGAIRGEYPKSPWKIALLWWWSSSRSSSCSALPGDADRGDRRSSVRSSSIRTVPALARGWRAAGTRHVERLGARLRAGPSRWTRAPLCRRQCGGRARATKLRSGATATSMSVPDAGMTYSMRWRGSRSLAPRRCSMRAT